MNRNLERRKLNERDDVEYLKDIINYYNSITDKTCKKIVEFLYQNEKEFQITDLSEKLGIETEVIYEALKKCYDTKYRIVYIYELDKEKGYVFYSLGDDAKKAFFMDRLIEGTCKEVEPGDEYDVLFDLSVD